MLQLLLHTPLWVWVVFLVLTILGIKHSRDHATSPGRLLTLSLLMMGLALYSTASTFGMAWLPFILLVAGFVIAVVLAKHTLPSPQIRRLSSGEYQLAGSWLPYGVMMTIFVIKYLLGMLHAQHSTLLNTSAFVGVTCLLLGMLSGIFMARNIAIWRVMRNDGRGLNGILPDRPHHGSQ